MGSGVSGWSRDVARGKIPEMTDTPEYWFRMEDRRVCSIDEYGDVTRAYPEVYAHRFKLLSRTKCGVWLNVYGDKRFLRSGSRRQFACPTFEEAKISFLARKAKQIRIYKSRIEHVEAAVRLADSLKEQ